MLTMSYAVTDIDVWVFFCITFFLSVVLWGGPAVIGRHIDNREEAIRIAERPWEHPRMMQNRGRSLFIVVVLEALQCSMAILGISLFLTVIGTIAFLFGARDDTVSIVVNWETILASLGMLALLAVAGVLAVAIDNPEEAGQLQFLAETEARQYRDVLRDAASQAERQDWGG
jgi:hypothetical protein